MRERFFRTLLVASAGYVVSIPLIYLFIRRLYEQGDTFAYICVAVAVLLTLPVLAIRSLRVYRSINDELTPVARDSGRQRVSARAVWLRSGLALLGAAIAGVGVVAILGTHVLLGAPVAAAGAIIVVGAAASLVKLMSPAVSRTEGDVRISR